MGTLVVIEYLSVDGVIEARVGGGGFAHAGWTAASGAARTTSPSLVPDVVHRVSVTRRADQRCV